MKAIYREAGDPPALMTPARMNARQGAMVLVELLAAEDFADMSILTTDWEGDGFTPVFTIHTVKWFPQYGGQRLEHHWDVDLEEAFGSDNIDNGTLRQIVSDIKAEFYRAIEAREKAGK